MGLHIFFKKSRRNQIKLFIERFNNIFGYEFKIDNAISSEFDKEFKLELDNNSGYLKINNIYDAKVFGDIEADIFPNKFNPDNINNFFDAVKYGYFSREKLDELFSEFRDNLVRAYVDIDGDGEDNPLDVLYEYDSNGSNLFIKLVRALEVMAEVDEELEELYEIIKENSNRSLLSSKLWANDRIRNKALSLAKENNVLAQEGSLKLYADDKDKLKEYYKEMIDKILKPLFDIESLDERMKRVR